MNKIRRKQLQEASELIAKAQGIIESVKDEEQEAHDNLPESIQYGEKGQQMEEYIDMLDEAYRQCDDLMSIIDNIREDTAYSMKERAEIAQKDARKAEKENKDLKAEIEDLKKTVEKRGATISELNTELCNARAEAKANEIPEELIQEMYCMAYDKEAESIGKMERAADQMTEATIAGEDAHGFAEEYKKQKENRNRYRKVMEMLDQRERRRAGRE